MTKAPEPITINRPTSAAERAAGVTPRVCRPIAATSSPRLDQHLLVPSKANQHIIWEMQPQKSWDFYVDETGGDFSRRDTSQLPGRVVGVLVPGASSLPPCPVAHSAGSDSGEVDRALALLLAQEVGVIGFSAGSFADVPSTCNQDRFQQTNWAYCILELVRWVARLLPVSGPTDLRVRIEQRIDCRPGNLNWLAGEITSSLAAYDAARARDLRIGMKVVPKGAPGLAFADVVAFTWGSPSYASRQRLQQSGLLGRCLFNSSPKQLRELWDRVKAGGTPDGEGWRYLAADQSWPAQQVLDRLSKRCRTDQPLWLRYADATRIHMDSGEVDVTRLSRELAWLSECAPSDAEMPLRQQHMMLVLQLAESKYRGRSVTQIERKVTAIADRLLDEEVRQVCLGDLHVASARTKSLDFDGATRALSRWTEEHRLALGKQYWGRILSARGQIDAFKGQCEAAHKLFDNALQLFATLSDPFARDREMSQTSNYRAINGMDSPHLQLDRKRELVEAVVGRLPGCIQRWSTARADDHPFRHHVLLRWLCEVDDPAGRRAYLASSGRWQTGLWHPWELIAFYRGLMLRGAGMRKEADSCFDQCEAICLTSDGGPTLAYVGAVLRCMLLRIRGKQAETQTLLKQLDAHLPAAKERLAFLHAWCLASELTDEPLRQCLPFYLR